MLQKKGTDQTLHLIRPTFMPIYLLGYAGCQAAISELFSRDSSCWTLCSTSSTVYASISIDFVVICSLRDCSNWTFSFASSTAYTFIANYVCHSMYPPFLWQNELCLFVFILIQMSQIYKSILCSEFNTKKKSFNQSTKRLEDNRTEIQTICLKVLPTVCSDAVFHAYMQREQHVWQPLHLLYLVLEYPLTDNPYEGYRILPFP